MIDHVGFAVADADRSRRFYEQALAPLGITLIMSVSPEQTEAGGTAHGFGSDGKPYFWIGDNERVGDGTHVAFEARNRDDVDAFYRAALAAGGTDHGAPGIITPTIMARSFTIPTGSMSRPSATGRSDAGAHLHHWL